MSEEDLMKCWSSWRGFGFQRNGMRWFNGSSFGGRESTRGTVDTDMCIDVMMCLSRVFVVVLDADLQGRVDGQDTPHT